MNNIFLKYYKNTVLKPQTTGKYSIFSITLNFNPATHYTSSKNVLHNMNI